MTPIIKVTRSRNKLSFFTIQEYERWRESVGEEARKWKTKYYKGLGTSTNKEAKEYFNHLRKHVIRFDYQNSQDDEAIDLVFNKKNI